MIVSQTFASNLKTKIVDVILSNMPEIDIVDTDSINEINNDIAAVIFETAEKTCGTFKRTKKQVNMFCKTARRYYHRCTKK